MAFKDFRGFLDALKENGELLEIDRKVDLKYEVAQALRKSASVEGPSCLFKNNGTNIALVGGLSNTRSKALIALESTEEDLIRKFMVGMAKRIRPKLVKRAPVQENVITGKAIDLSAWPIPTYSPDDGGPYITSGIVVSQDPDTGVTDIGNYRFEYVNKNTLSFLAQPNHRFGKNLAKAVRKGAKKFRAALVIGVDPAISYAAQAQVSDDTEDFEVAGGIRGKAVELVKCTTSATRVPAHAEVVIEFEVNFGTKFFEGPLGEYTGYYTEGSDKPTATVLAITHRDDPYFQALLTGKPPTENHILKQIPWEASFLKAMQAQFPTISQVSIPPSGGVSFRIVIAMKERYAGEARSAILAAMASNLRPKIVVVVDLDIDISKSEDIEWAIAFRTQPARDIFIIESVPGGPLDPSIDPSVALKARTGSAIGILAIYPFGTVIHTAGKGRSRKNQACGPAVAEKGHEFVEVATVPGWQEYSFPELDAVMKRQALPAKSRPDDIKGNAFSAAKSVKSKRARA